MATCSLDVFSAAESSFWCRRIVVDLTADGDDMMSGDLTRFLLRWDESWAGLKEMNSGQTQLATPRQNKSPSRTKDISSLDKEK